MRGTILIALLMLAASLFAPAASVSADEHEGPDSVYFEQTGHYLSGDFLVFWREYGGIPTFGFPISPVIEQDDITVQYFERHVFEYHPDNPDDYKVLLRRLGAEARDDRQLMIGNSFKSQDETDSGRYFTETQQNMQGDFLEYWEEFGGTRIFGYPLSTRFTHRGTQVQFTERAIFEYHPDHSAEWQILFERLGAQAAERDGIDTSARDHDGDTPQFSADLWQPEESEAPAEPEENLSPPSQFMIPKIGVSAPVEHVGYTPQGNMQAPYGWHNTAWFEPGTVPGERGNAVIAGHYDAPGGVPATFWDLNALVPGDLVTVLAQDGSELVFQVTEVEQFTIGNEPTGKIFGSTDQRNLNLITCAGTWSTGLGMYDQRLVVYTTLVS